VVDVNEAEFRKNRLSAKLFGYLTISRLGTWMQGSKSITGSSEDVELDAIAEYLVERSTHQHLHSGSGFNGGTYAERLGVKKALLGVDAVRRWELLGGGI